MPASATLTKKGLQPWRPSLMLAACDVRRRLCAHLKVALEDSLSKFVFHELMTPDANALIRAMCALALSP